MYSGWKHFSEKGYFQDSGMTNKQLQKSLEESGLTTDEKGIVLGYFNDINKAKERYIVKENSQRIKDGENPLTISEELNVFRGKKNRVRESFTKEYKEEASNFRNAKQEGFEKIEGALDDLLDIFSDVTVNS